MVLEIQTSEIAWSMDSANLSCDFEKLKNGRWRCSRCRYVTRKAYAQAPKRNCPNGLGDKLARTLALVGITKARYARWRGSGSYMIVGGCGTAQFVKAGKLVCGCEGRQLWLNRAGEAAKRWLNRRSHRERPDTG